MKNKDSYIFNYAVKLLSRRQYAEKELENKLTSKFDDSRGLISDVLNRLRSLNYLNDENYIRTYISTRLQHSPKGKLGYLYRLKQKGIQSDVFNAVWRSLDLDEKSLCLTAIRHKLKKINVNDLTYREKVKLAGYLYRQCHSADIIRECLKFGLTSLS